MTKKKLIEVALPLEAINAACKADKDRKTGTIRNLHKWFAPMPVPALRALIFASLVDDPEDDVERQRLLRLMEELVGSVVENPPPRVLEEAKRQILKSTGELPTVLDPFCGGGSTLVEAQRLGLPSRGSDLNPVPVLISKMLTEYPPVLNGLAPLHASETRTQWSQLDGFRSDIDHYAARIREEASNRLEGLFPAAPNGDPVIAWWWARTVESPDPRFQGVHVPLVNDWWLSKKKGANVYLQPVPDPASRLISYELLDRPRTAVPKGLTCLLSGMPIGFDYIKEQGRNGRIGTTLLATISHGRNGRRYHLPDASQVKASMLRVVESNEAALELPESALGFTYQLYGYDRWSDVYTSRQLQMLSVFAGVVGEIYGWAIEDGANPKQAEALSIFFSLALGKLSQHSSTLVRWLTRASESKATSAFGQQVVSMTWDFAEVNPFGGSVGDWMQIVSTAKRAFSYIEPSGPSSQVRQSDARETSADLDNQCLIVTDPPYFAAIGYANLSDYFYVWLRPALRGVFPNLFSTAASPKVAELIAEPARHETKDQAKQYFIDGFVETFRNVQRLGRADLPIVIVYAYKERENERESSVSSGWEAMLEAVKRSGLTVQGTWPISGTGPARLRGVGSNAIASYVALVCRRRSNDLERCGRREFSALLRTELAPAIKLLQQAAIAPVDLAQAVIGPGMAVFTRFEDVLEADGSIMTVRSALLLINSVLAEVLDQQEGDFDSVTRWALAWFEQHQFGSAPSGDADALARAKVTSIESLERSGVLVTSGGRARLVSRAELADDYSPALDATPTVWEAVQHLVKAVENLGEQGASALLRTVQNQDGARELAYALFAVCEKRGWAEEASAYNSLVASWPEIARLAQVTAVQALDREPRLPGV